MVFEPQIFTKEIPATPAILGISTPPGTLYQPRDVAVNSTDYIFVADTLNSRISIFNPDGTFNSLMGFPGNDPDNGSLNQPYGIFINSTDFIHVVDTFTNVIKVYNPTNTYVKTIGQAGTGENEYYYPSGMTMTNSSMIIADTFNHRIIVTNLSGQNVTTIPLP